MLYQVNRQCCPVVQYVFWKKTALRMLAYCPDKTIFSRTVTTFFCNFLKNVQETVRVSSLLLNYESILHSYVLNIKENNQHNLEFALSSFLQWCFQCINCYFITGSYWKIQVWSNLIITFSKMLTQIQLQFSFGDHHFCNYSYAKSFFMNNLFKFINIQASHWQAWTSTTFDILSIFTQVFVLHKHICYVFYPINIKSAKNRFSSYSKYSFCWIKENIKKQIFILRYWKLCLNNKIKTKTAPNKLHLPLWII